MVNKENGYFRTKNETTDSGIDSHFGRLAGRRSWNGAKPSEKSTIAWACNRTRGWLRGWGRHPAGRAPGSACAGVRRVRVSPAPELDARTAGDRQGQDNGTGRQSAIRGHEPAGPGASPASRKNQERFQPARATAGTIRLRFLKVAAQAHVSVQWVAVQLSSANPLSDLFRLCHRQRKSAGMYLPHPFDRCNPPPSPPKTRATTISLDSAVKTAPQG